VSGTLEWTERTSKIRFSLRSLRPLPTLARDSSVISDWAPAAAAGAALLFTLIAWGRMIWTGAAEVRPLAVTGKPREVLLGAWASAAKILGRKVCAEA